MVLPTYKLIFHFHFPETKKCQKYATFTYGNFRHLRTNLNNVCFYPDWECTKINYIRFHDFRHSCAPLLYDSGIDMKAIQKWLGHSNISTTMNIYAHLNYKNKVISANAIAGIIPNYKEKEPRTAAN